MMLRHAGWPRSGLVRAVIVVLAITLAPGPAWAAPDAPPPVPMAATAAPGASSAGPGVAAAPPNSPGSLTELQKQGYGCLIGASTVMALAGAVGAAEVVQIYTGGEVGGANSLLLWVTLFVGVAATACSAASAATPAILHAWAYFHGYLEDARNRP